MNERDDDLKNLVLFMALAAIVVIFGLLGFIKEIIQNAGGTPTVIRLDLTPEAMKACAEAFARYGYWDVRDYECRVERGPKGMVVALYGPGADGKAGEKKRLGEVPLEKR